LAHRDGVPAAQRLLLTSIHDVSPRFESEIDRLIDLLKPHVAQRMTMLVVPNHWGDAPIIPGSPFARRLRGWAESGVEIFLHGFFHRDDSRHESPVARLKARFMTAGEGEFLGLSSGAAASRIFEGRSLVEEVIGRPLDGFVAPAWLYGAGAMEALAASLLPIAEDHWRVWHPATGKELARAPVITWASRTRLRLLSSLAAAAALRHAPTDVLRIGVHPPDCRHPPLVRSIEKSLRSALKSRRAGRYSDLLAASAAA
jgi:predicted deacetylase